MCEVPHTAVQAQRLLVKAPSGCMVSRSETWPGRLRLPALAQQRRARPVHLLEPRLPPGLSASSASVDGGGSGMMIDPRISMATDTPHSLTAWPRPDSLTLWGVAMPIAAHRKTAREPSIRMAPVNAGARATAMRDTTTTAPTATTRSRMLATSSARTGDRKLVTGPTAT